MVFVTSMKLGGNAHPNCWGNTWSLSICGEGGGEKGAEGAGWRSGCHPYCWGGSFILLASRGGLKKSAGG